MLVMDSCFFLFCVVVGFLGATSFGLWFLLCFDFWGYFCCLFGRSCWLCFTSLIGGYAGFFGCGCGVCWICLVVDATPSARVQFEIRAVITSLRKKCCNRLNKDVFFSFHLKLFIFCNELESSLFSHEHIA